MTDHDHRYMDLVNTPGLQLAHETLADARDCDTCTIAQEENAHTMRDYLPHGLAFLQGELDRRATCYPAEITAHELICWCGHSLHLSYCKDEGLCHLEDSPHYGYCRDTWVRRVWQQDKDQLAAHMPPAVWSCPGEAPHRARIAVWQDGGRTLWVWCRDCMVISEVDMATGSIREVQDA